MKKIWSDILLESLSKHWVEIIFGYPGWANMPLYDKLELFEPIKHILVRNEQWAAFAAEWVARSTKKLWVALWTSGPWASNLITWIMDAYMDSIPTLFITWQVAYPLMWNDVFQELDVIWTTMSIVKHSFLVDDVNQIPQIIDEAVKIATTGRPWPVLIDFPKDISLAEFTGSKNLDYSLHYKKNPKSEINNDNIEATIEMLYEAKKPVLLIWQWVKFSDWEKELNEFVNITWIPTVSTLLAKWVLREDNPNYLWMLWMHGFYEANLAVHNADLILNIWSRFDDRIVWTYPSFAKNAKVIHLDIDKSELKKLVKTNLAINWDAKDFLKKLLNSNLKKLKIDEWKQQINYWENSCPFERETKHFSIKNALNTINDETSKDLNKFIFCTDVGQHQMWSAQVLKVANTKSWMTSWWAWTMWFSIPTSMWAAFVNPEKIIINIVWDWSVQMNIQELQVLAEHNLNVKVIIMNNSFLWMVRQWQDLFFDKNYASTPIGSPDYVKLAEAYRIRWYRAHNSESFAEVIAEEFSKTWPCVIEVVIKEFEDNIFPMVAPWKTLWETMTCK